MINNSISVTVQGKEFSSVKKCCEYFNIDKNKVYKYKSKNNCTYEEAIIQFIIQDYVEDGTIVEELVQEEVIPEPVEEETVVEEPTPVVEEPKEEPPAPPVVEEPKEEVITTPSEPVQEEVIPEPPKPKKLTLFQRIKKWLFG